MAGETMMDGDADLAKNIPSDLSKLKHPTTKKNHADTFSNTAKNLSCLLTLNLCYNQLTHTSIPPEVFENKELSTLDISYNLLKEVPERLV